MYYCLMELGDTVISQNSSLILSTETDLVCTALALKA